MKKFKLLTVLTLTLIQYCLLSQVPNGSFEQWEPILGYDKPVDWQTNQTVQYQRFMQDTLSIDGNYSLKVVPSAASAFQDCRSLANTTVKYDVPIGANQSLFFFVQSRSVNPQGDTFLKIEGAFYNGNSFVDSYTWETQEEILSFNQIEIPIPAPFVDSLTINITGGAQNGPADGCLSASESWIDGLSIKPSTVTKVTNQPSIPIKVFPNPSNGRINIKALDVQLARYQIIDQVGRVIQTGSIDNGTIEVLPKGVFTLVIKIDQFTDPIYSNKIMVK